MYGPYNWEITMDNDTEVESCGAMWDRDGIIQKCSMCGVNDDCKERSFKDEDGPKYNTINKQVTGHRTELPVPFWQRIFDEAWGDIDFDALPETAKASAEYWRNQFPMLFEKYGEQVIDDCSLVDQWYADAVLSALMNTFMKYDNEELERRMYEFRVRLPKKTT